MDNRNKIIPPHLNAEVYRTDTTGTDTISYLDYIRLHPDGSILVGCSELTGRYWNGGASVYRNIAEAQQIAKDIRKSVYLTSGSPDGCFIVHSSRVLVCEDSGAVGIWVTNDDAWQTWTEEMTVAEHDDAVMGVECLEEGQEYVTVGADGNIKVWDISEMICMRNFNAAHSRAIYGVAVKPNSVTSFATGSLDRYVTLWDESSTKPINDLVKNDCGIRCLAWLDENNLLYGDEAGVLRQVDVRNSNNMLTLAEFPAAVHKLAVKTGTQNVAVCCDNKTVTVCDVSPGSVPRKVYIDKLSHHNYVRGLAWDLKQDNLLLSIGWDGEVKTHLVMT